MIKLFIKECLFFQSDEIVNRIFGIVGWISIAMLLYSIVTSTLALLGYDILSLL